MACGADGRRVRDGDADPAHRCLAHVVGRTHVLVSFVGTLVISLGGGFATVGVHSVLFGSIATVSGGNVLLMGMSSVVVAIAVYLLAVVASSRGIGPMGV